MKYRVGIFFGGKSAEHDVSISSARNIIRNLDKTKYTIVPVGIDREGLWHLTNTNLEFHEGTPPVEAIGQVLPLIDVAFSVLHGPFGEDGSFQGLFEVMKIPYVGPGVLGSAVGLDKDVMKRLLRDAKIPVADFLVFHTTPSFDAVVQELGLPVFIKSANMGSSVCLTKATTEQEFYDGVELAFQYDSKIIIEKSIPCTEIECSVLGTDPPRASLPGEIVVQGGVYTYDIKYITSEKCTFVLPAPLDAKKTQEVQELAIRTCQILCAQGLARVDFFLDENGKLYVNEINTLPGFTNTSLYPILWEISGLSYTDLLTELIEDAFLRFEQKKNRAVYRACLV